MAKPFQKALLLCVRRYSLYNSFLEIIKELSCESKGFDFRDNIRPYYLHIQTQMFRFPAKIRNVWEKKLLKEVNDKLLSSFFSYKPDLVFVYNSEYLLPETCGKIKKSARLVFFMGDSPFFTPINPYYLACLPYADLILSPDSFWLFQLNTLGIQKTSFFIPGLDVSSYHTIDDKYSLESVECRDVLYTGASYVNSWGYKKALLMSKFTRFDFRIYGNSSWQRWFRFFPDLETHYTQTGYIPTDQLNKMFNKTKLMPVDGNPAILNGFHLRLFEALGAGVLPLTEYRKDVEELLFKDSRLMVPLIKDYTQAGTLAEYYLKNENERKGLAASLKEYILLQYNSVRNSERIIELLDNYSVR